MEEILKKIDTIVAGAKMFENPEIVSDLLALKGLIKGYVPHEETIMEMRLLSPKENGFLNQVRMHIYQKTRINVPAAISVDTQELKRLVYMADANTVCLSPDFFKKSKGEASKALLWTFIESSSKDPASFLISKIL